MRISTKSGAIIAGAAAAIAASAGEIAHRAVFPGADTRIPDTAALRVFVPEAERLEYASADGAPLVAAWFPVRGARATVVYFHATNQSAGDAVLFARDLQRRGFSVLLPEHRGYGGLAGRPSAPALFADAEAALALVERDVPVILVGRSLGAAVAAELSGRGVGDALVIVSPFTSTAEMAPPFAWALAPDDRFDVRASLSRVRVPVTVVHGTDDALIPFRMGRALAAESRARFVPLAGAGHNDLFLGETREALLDAIHRAVPGTRVAQGAPDA